MEPISEHSEVDYLNSQGYAVNDGIDIRFIPQFSFAEQVSRIFIVKKGFPALKNYILKHLVPETDSTCIIEYGQ